MARQIIWSVNAHRERMEILRYWEGRNGSLLYSTKLDGLFRKALQVISAHPLVGRPTTEADVRVKGVGDYLLFYSYSDQAIHVLSVWHSKRSPAERPY